MVVIKSGYPLTATSTVTILMQQYPDAICIYIKYVIPNPRKNILESTIVIKPVILTCL
jgi:hypothetical protein